MGKTRGRGRPRQATQHHHHGPEGSHRVTEPSVTGIRSRAVTGRGEAKRSGIAPKKQRPIDPLTGPKLALAGRVVTMDDAFTVRTDAVVYIDQRRHRRGAGTQPAGACRFRRCGACGYRRHDLSRIDRTAQSPQLQRAAALEPGAQAVPAPRTVARPPRLPQADQRTDDRRGRIP